MDVCINCVYLNDEYYNIAFINSNPIKKTGKSAVNGSQGDVRSKNWSISEQEK